MLGGRLNASSLGRSIPGPVAAKHGIKRVDRLLGNRHLHNEVAVFFRAIAHALLDGQRQPILLVDWTDVGDKQVAISAAVPIGGRALPLYFEVHPLSAYGTPRTHRLFLDTLRDQILPKGCRPIVVTDAGFANPWFREVLSRNWDFVGRVGSTVLTAPGDQSEKDLRHRNSWEPAKTWHARASSRPRDLGLRVVSRKTPLVARLVLYKQRPKGRKGARKVNRRGVHPGASSYKKYQRRSNEPWLLSTSMPDGSAKRIIRIYRTRMQIEESFRDAKNHRFGWSFEDARSASCVRLQVLLLLDALAMLAVTLLGKAAELLHIHRAYQANTTRHRRVLSLFFLGKLVYNDRDRPWRPPEHLVKRSMELLREAISPGPEESLVSAG